MDTPATPAPIYAQFDGDEIDGHFYKLGEPIERERHDAATLAYLEGQGRIGGQKPKAYHVDTTVPVKAMDRMALLAELADGIDDDKLRETVESKRAALAPESDEPDDEDGDDLLKLSIPKLRERLASVDDLGELRDLLDAEKAGQNRAGAVDAIDDRIKAIEPA